MAHTAGLVHEAQIGGIPALFLDTRALRDGRRSPPQILTRPAWGVLRAWLRGLADKPGPKLIVTGSPIAPGFAANVDRNGTIDPFASATDDNWQRFDEERRHLFDFIVATHDLAGAGDVVGVGVAFDARQTAPPGRPQGGT